MGVGVFWLVYILMRQELKNRLKKKTELKANMVTRVIHTWANQRDRRRSRAPAAQYQGMETIAMRLLRRSDYLIKRQSRQTLFLVETPPAGRFLRTEGREGRTVLAPILTEWSSMTQRGTILTSQEMA